MVVEKLNEHSSVKKVIAVVSKVALVMAVPHYQLYRLIETDARLELWMLMVTDLHLKMFGIHDKAYGSEIILFQARAISVRLKLYCSICFLQKTSDSCVGEDLIQGL